MLQNINGLLTQISTTMGFFPNLSIKLAFAGILIQLFLIAVVFGFILFKIISKKI